MVISDKDTQLFIPFFVDLIHFSHNLLEKYLVVNKLLSNDEVDRDIVICYVK
jgi:hypothetical protein